MTRLGQLAPEKVTSSDLALVSSRVSLSEDGQDRKR